MLDKVTPPPKQTARSNDGDDSSDGGWEDDDEPVKTPSKPPPATNNKGVGGLKKAVSAPPPTSKPPPVRVPSGPPKSAPPSEAKPPTPAIPSAPLPTTGLPRGPPPGGAPTATAMPPQAPVNESKADGSTPPVGGPPSSAPPAATQMKKPSGPPPATEKSRKRLSVFAQAMSTVNETPMTVAQEEAEKLDKALAEESARSNMSAVKELLGANQRIHELESEVHELHKKIERAESRATHAPGSAEALSRETTLEKELAATTDALQISRSTIRTLETTIGELQSSLTSVDTTSALSLGNVNFSEESAKSAERMRALEDGLIRAKEEKDRAIRVLISILGPEKIATFLNKHAGSTDILSALQEHFAGQVNFDPNNPNSSGGSSRGPGPLSGKTSFSKPAKSKGHKAGKSVPTMGANRSRIDEFFKGSGTIMGYGV
jgi:predicted  nucleic acid-binding Zn-ribbon protein